MTRPLARRLLLRTLLGGAIALAATGSIGCASRNEVTLAPPAEQTGIAVTGTGSVPVKPDIARLNLGVEVSDPSLATARTRAAEAMTRVQEAVKQKGVQDRDIRTQQLNIAPQYTTTPDRAIRGYTITNQMQLTIRNVDGVAEVLDAAVTAGGNAVRANGISFAVDQPEQHLAQARADAVKNARTRAEALAKAAGVTLGNARSITESTGGSPIVPERLGLPAGVASAPATPVSPGEQTLQVTVSVVYDISR